MCKVPAPEFTNKSISTEVDGLVTGIDVTLQLQAAKECHCERSEAISRLRGLLRRFTPRNDKSTPLLTEGQELAVEIVDKPAFLMRDF